VMLPWLPSRLKADWSFWVNASSMGSPSPQF
jgi:hypothetical protein